MSRRCTRGRQPCGKRGRSDACPIRRTWPTCGRRVCRSCRRFREACSPNRPRQRRCSRCESGLRRLSVSNRRRQESTDRERREPGGAPLSFGAPQRSLTKCEECTTEVGWSEEKLPRNVYVG